MRRRAGAPRGCRAGSGRAPSLSPLQAAGRGRSRRSRPARGRRGRRRARAGVGRPTSAPPTSMSPASRRSAPARLDGRGRRPRRTAGRGTPTRRSRAGARALRLVDHAAAARPTSSSVSPSVDEALEHGELGLEPVRVDRRARDQLDLRVRARRRRLAVADEHLVELLARRRADELDRDLASRAPCRRGGSCSRRGRRCGRARPCRARRPGPRPPIAPAWTTSCTASGIVMKNRVISGCVTVTGPPSRDLPAEDRDHRARGAEHVAEPHGDEPRRHVAAVAPRLDDPLASAFDWPITVFGFAALSVETSTNRLAPYSTATSASVARAERVVAHGLDRVRLHQRDVLVRGRVEDDARAGTCRRPGAA